MLYRVILSATILGATAMITGLSSAAQASIISFQSRFASGPLFVDANGAQSAVEGLTAFGPSSGYCDAAPAAWDGLSNMVTCGGSGADIAFDITATFGVSAAQAGTWSFRVGPDFGLGGALFLDGVAVDFRSTDMWWNGSYADPTQILVATAILSAGNHLLEAYGVELCCDGPQQAQFFAPSSTGFVTFGTGDGLDVPEPATLALLGLGLAGLGFSRRKQ